jgi:hypothetical protein
MDPKGSALIPVKQTFITLAGYQFLVVQVPDGRIAIVLSYLCEALGVDRKSQTRRIQEHPLLAEHLVTVQIETPKGERIVNALVVWALSGWLSGFQLARLSEEKQEVILVLQREAFNTFVRPFFTPEQPTSSPKQPPPQPEPEPEPAAAPLPPGGEQEIPDYTAQFIHGIIGLRIKVHNQDMALRQIKVDLIGQLKAELAQQHGWFIEHTKVIDQHTMRLREERVQLTDMKAALEALTAQANGQGAQAAHLLKQVEAMQQQLNKAMQRLDTHEAQSAQLKQQVETLAGQVIQVMRSSLLILKREQALRAMPYDDYLKTEEWQMRRQAALRQADYQCFMCPNKSKLEVHHRTYERLGAERPEDLIVLCESCHRRHHGMLAHRPTR